MSWASGMRAYSEAGPAWLENCALTQPMPVARAFSMAISAARLMTRWPMPLSPLTSAVEACSRTTRMFGLVLKPPALMRRAYCGSRLTPWPSEPCRSAWAISAGDDGGIAIGQAELVHCRVDESL